MTKEQIKTQLRIDPSDGSFDDQITPLIAAAREWCEGFQNRAYVQQTFELAFDNWPCGNVIKLPRPALQTVEWLKYTDDKGVTTTWDVANYVVDAISEPGRLVKQKKASWPAGCLAAANGITIRYIAGYPPKDADHAANIPSKFKQAIILLACWWFENENAEPPQAVKSLLWLDRVVPV